MNTLDLHSESDSFPHQLYVEMLNRFPEVSDHLQKDSDHPYMLMSHLADWIINQEEIPPSLVDRVARFAHWCESQPPGIGPSEDPLTILVVGLYESLFESENTLALLPKLASRKTLIENADYFKAWIGEENYRRALNA